MKYQGGFMRNNKILFSLYQIYKYLIFYPFIGISTAFFGSMAVLFSILIHQKVGTLMGILWARVNSYMTPMWVTVKGKENIQKGQSYVVVANHQSQYDIFVLYGWFPLDFKWVMKIQLRKVPFLGYSCYKIGHVFIDRSNHERAVESINAAKERITGGTSIVFFPEGRRSKDGALLPMKKGAFKFALDMGLPILPVTIVGTKDILPSGTTELFPGKAKMIIQPPIDISPYTDDNIEGLMEKAKISLEQGLN